MNTCRSQDHKDERCNLEVPHTWSHVRIDHNLRSLDPTGQQK
jgi:hypothetical protein